MILMSGKQTGKSLPSVAAQAISTRNNRSIAGRSWLLKVGSSPTLRK